MGRMDERGNSNPKSRLRPGKAVRKQCLICMGGSSSDVKACETEYCLLHPHRMGEGRVTLKLMRTYCLHCCGWPLDMEAWKDRGERVLDPDYKDGGQAEAWRESRDCTDPECPFWPYRPGTKPMAGRGVGKGHNLTSTSGTISAPESTEEDRPYTHPAPGDSGGF